MPQDGLGFDFDQIANQIATHEGGFLDRVFEDPESRKGGKGKILLVGAGSNITGESGKRKLSAIGVDPESVMSGKRTLTPEETQKLFKNDLNDHIAIARKHVRNFDQQPTAVQRALVDMTYTLGDKGFGSFRAQTLPLIEQGRYEEAANNLSKQKWAKQVGSFRANNILTAIKTQDDRSLNFTQQDVDKVTRRNSRNKFGEEIGFAGFKREVAEATGGFIDTVKEAVNTREMSVFDFFVPKVQAAEAPQAESPFAAFAETPSQDNSNVFSAFAGETEPPPTMPLIQTAQAEIPGFTDRLKGAVVDSVPIGLPPAVTNKIASFLPEERQSTFKGLFSSVPVRTGLAQVTGLDIDLPEDERGFNIGTIPEQVPLLGGTEVTTGNLQETLGQGVGEASLGFGVARALGTTAKGVSRGRAALKGAAAEDAIQLAQIGAAQLAGDDNFLENPLNAGIRLGLGTLFGGIGGLADNVIANKGIRLDTPEAGVVETEVLDLVQEVEESVVRNIDTSTRLPDEVRMPLQKYMKQKGIQGEPEDFVKIRQEADELINGGDELDTMQRRLAEGGDIEIEKLRTERNINIRAIAGMDEEDILTSLSAMAEDLPKARSQNFDDIVNDAAKMGISITEADMVGETIDTMGKKILVAEANLKSGMKSLQDMNLKLRKDPTNVKLQRDFAMGQAGMMKLLNAVRTGRSASGRLQRSLRGDVAVTPVDKIMKTLIKAGKMNDDIFKMIIDTDMSNPAEIAELVDQLNQPTLGQRLGTLYVSNLLSGVKTLGVNLTGNASWGAVSSVLRPMAATIDAGITGARRAMGQDVGKQRFFRETANSIASATALVDGLSRASVAMGRSLWTGVPQFDSVTKLDVPISGKSKLRVVGGPGGLLKGKAGDVVDTALTVPVRMLFSTDDFFKGFGLTMNRQAIATREVLIDAASKGEALSDKQLRKRVTDVLDNRKNKLFSKVENEAVRITRENVFQGDAGPLTETVMALRGKIPGARWVIPFVRTPIQLVGKGVQVSPLQAFRILGKGVASAKGKDFLGFTKFKNQGEVSDELAKLAMGSLISYMAIQQMEEGRLTGGGSFKPDAQKAIDELTGKKPYSFATDLIPGIDSQNWAEYTRIDPASIAVGMVADLYEAYQNDSLVSAADAMVAIQQTMINNITNKLFIKNIKDILEIGSQPDPRRRGAYMTRVASNIGLGFVPYSALISQLSRANVPERTKAKTLWENVQRRTGMTGNLFTLHNMLGEKKLDNLDTAENIWATINNAVGPVRVNQPTQPLIAQEFERLGVKDLMSPMGFKLGKIDLTPQEYNDLNAELNQVIVPALNAVMFGDQEGLPALTEVLRDKRDSQFKARRKAISAMERYKLLPDDPDKIIQRGKVIKQESKVDLIEKVMDRSRRMARQIITPDVIDRLKLSGLSDRDIANLKAGNKTLEELQK